jgi:hypothetical protein
MEQVEGVESDDAKAVADCVRTALQYRRTNQKYARRLRAEIVPHILE